MRLAWPCGIWLAALICLTLTLWTVPGQAADRDTYLAAIEAERRAEAPPRGVTGITVPHHLLAADLMARGFWAASAGDYDRVILVSPDHFRTLSRPFGVVTEGFDTPFGPLPVDDAATALLADTALFERIAPEAQAAEHGLTSLAPFIRHFWPDAEVIALLGHIDSQPPDWQAAADALSALVTERTLVVQSTDYSHYLPVADAILRDQETLGMIAAGDGLGLAHANQPGHLDSKAAQAVQMHLQRALGASPVVIANRNHVSYGGSPRSTTSYIVAVWHPDPRAGAALRYADHDVFYLAGDLLAGRFLTTVLATAPALDVIAAEVEGIVAGAPLIANLEGVLLDAYPVGLAQPAHVMVDALAGPVMKRLGVTAAGLANNHATDLGPVGLDETRRLLDAHGIAALEHGRIEDLGPVRLLPLTMLQNVPAPELAVDAPVAARVACETQAPPPLVAYLHWGTEYTSEPGAGETALAAALAECGVSAVVGHHSHQSSAGITSIAGGRLQMVYSVGNFLFDQSGDHTSGALAEMRVFEQGTIALRLIGLPNLFNLGRSMID